MSTSLLVNKMSTYAESKNYNFEIKAFPEGEIAEQGKMADVIFLGPQIRYRLAHFQSLFPNKIVSIIDMQDYGLVRGDNVVENAISMFAKDSEDS